MRRYEGDLQVSAEPLNWGLNSEEALRVGCCSRSKLVGMAIAQAGDAVEGLGKIGGLIAFAAMRCTWLIGRVALQQQIFERHV